MRKGLPLGFGLGGQKQRTLQGKEACVQPRPTPHSNPVLPLSPSPPRHSLSLSPFSQETAKFCQRVLKPTVPVPTG